MYNMVRNSPKAGDINTNHTKIWIMGEMRKGKGPVLFNLADDVGELKDLSAEFPEKVEELRALAEQRLAEITRNVIPLVR